MSELRCPICGTPNPEDAQICSLCQTQIKPFIGGQSSDLTGGESHEADWLSGLRRGMKHESGSPTDGDDGEHDDSGKEVPDWLERIRQRAQADEAAPRNGCPAQDDSSPAGDETPAWLKDIQSGSAPQEGEKDDWFSLPESSTDEGSETTAPHEDDSSQKAAAGLPAKGNDIPGWTNGGEEEQPPDEAAALDEEAGLPFWLKELERAEAEASPEMQPAEDQEGLPDLVQAEVPGGGAMEVEEAATPVEEAESEEGIGAPAAFTIPIEEFERQPEAEVKAPPPFVGEPVEGEALASASPFSEENLFDWLDEYAPQHIPEEKTPGAAPLSPQAEQEPTPAGGKTGYPFSADDLPDWLSEVTLQETADQPALADEAGLEPTELPGWLEAMRPVEAVAPKAETEGGEEAIASSGPLAGLPGILASVTQAVGYSKPPEYSASLKLTEKQRAHADLLEKVLADETQPRQPHRELIKARPRLLRLMVGVILIAVLVISGLSTAGATGLHASPDLFNFNNKIEAIPDGAPVLLAFEYQPGYSGEMHRTAGGVLSRLIAKNARLTLVSTVPAGPILAEQLIDETARRVDGEGEIVNPGYTTGEMAVNLGYLPGGIASLQEFSLRPQQASRYGLMSALDGSLAWTHPALAGVGALRDFSAVVVIADSLESGRAWVEQVQPSLGETPLLVIASAQAAPLLQPYLASGQIGGMIAGVTGGVVYQEISQAAVENGFLNAYRSGMLLAVLLILAGVILHGASALYSGRKSSSG